MSFMFMGHQATATGLILAPIARTGCSA
jgi:hypothetical protein